MDPNLEAIKIPLVGIVAMVATIIIKSAIWVWCRTIKNTSIEALTLDAENDIVFNFFSLIFPLIGQQIGWPYLDPLGGALLSIYIIVEWTRTLFENAGKLTGKRATPAEHQRVAYLLTRFSPLIQGIQHVSVYASGDHNVVEADIIVDESLALRTSHNIGESAQYCLEQLDGIERAFVHLDITANAFSGHIDRS